MAYEVGGGEVKIADLKGESDSNIKIVGDLNILLSVTEHSDRKPMKKQ